MRANATRMRIQQDEALIHCDEAVRKCGGREQSNNPNSGVIKARIHLERLQTAVRTSARVGGEEGRGATDSGRA